MFELMRKDIFEEAGGAEIEDDYVVETFATEQEAAQEARKLNETRDWEELDNLNLYQEWWVREA